MSHQAADHELEEQIGELFQDMYTATILAFVDNEVKGLTFDAKKRQRGEDKLKYAVPQDAGTSIASAALSTQMEFAIPNIQSDSWKL